MLYHLYLKYGKEDGGVAIKTNFADLYQVDTTTWHNYGLVVDPASKTYTVYVDGREVMKHTSTWTLSGRTSSGWALTARAAAYGRAVCPAPGRRPP